MSKNKKSWRYVASTRNEDALKRNCAKRKKLREAGLIKNQGGHYEIQ